MFANRQRHPIQQPVAAEYVESIREGGGIRRGQAGTDNIDAVTDNIREQQPNDSSRIGQGGHSSALERRQVLSDLI